MPESSFPIYRDTLVGFFDIIGYSSYIEKTPLEKAVQEISHFLYEATSLAGTNALAVKLDHWILSDSIIITVDTNRHPLFAGSLEVFLVTCSMVMWSGMQHRFPLRGAVGGGDFYKDGAVMVSSALVDAASYEKEQEWLGAVLTPKAIAVMEKAKEFDIREKTRIDFSSDKFMPYLRYGPIPWKRNEGPDKRHIYKPDNTYYIKPYDMAEVDWVSKYLPDYFDTLKKKRMIECSHSLYAQNEWNYK